MRLITIGLMWVGLLTGQTSIDPIITGGTGAPVPPCANGELYFDAGAAAGQNLYVCVSSGWTQISGTASGGVRTDASNTFAAGTVQSFLGTLDASSAGATLPAQTGSTLPATCSKGQIFLDTGADPSRMLYACSATNTWTQTGYMQGTTAQMPAACAPGQTYFATDAAAGSNLYFCTGSNTWTQMAGCSNCLTGPGSSTSGNVPQWNGTLGNALAAGLAVSTGTAGSSLAQRDGGGSLTAASFSANGGAILSQYYVNGYYRFSTSQVDSKTCTSGAVSLSDSYSTHRVNLNNQASCTITLGTGNSVTGEFGTVLLCNGSTTATTAITWSGLKGGMAAGGTAGQCAAQTIFYDSTNSAWYASGAGSAWN